MTLISCRAIHIRTTSSLSIEHDIFMSRSFFSFLILLLASTPWALNSGKFAVLTAEAYEHGWGVPRDDVSAFRWFYKAAERGNAAAQSVVAWDLSQGIGTRADRAGAVRWWTEAAKAGDPNALIIVGDSYCLGAGVIADADQARVWWQKAADKGNADAKARLSEPGCMGLRDLVRAKWRHHRY
jgi:TPR repeat protein